MCRTATYTLVLFLLLSCGQPRERAPELSAVEVAVQVNRFEQEFYRADDQTLQEVKNTYPYLFPEQTPDSIWLSRIRDEQALFGKTQAVFGDFQDEKKKLSRLFKHVKYYHPDFNAPQTVTLITNLDYQYRVVYADSLLLLSLDMYLGASDSVYTAFPRYLAEKFEKQRLVTDIANAIAAHYVGGKRHRQLVENMVEEGKKKYLTAHYLPGLSEAENMGYTTEAFSWAQSNEMKVWEYFLSNALLYSTDQQLYKRFIAVAPFSKFYTAADREAPGQIGVYMGWQIVRSYMKQHSISLSQLLGTPPMEIFKNANYKPPKKWL